MDRLGALDPAGLTGESKQLYKDIKDYFEGNVKYGSPSVCKQVITDSQIAIRTGLTMGRWSDQ